MDFGVGQGARKEHIRMDLRPTSNAATTPKGAEAGSFYPYETASTSSGPRSA